MQDWREDLREQALQDIADMHMYLCIFHEYVCDWVGLQTYKGEKDDEGSTVAHEHSWEKRPVVQGRYENVTKKDSFGGGMKLNDLISCLKNSEINMYAGIPLVLQ